MTELPTGCAGRPTGREGDPRRGKASWPSSRPEGQRAVSGTTIQGIPKTEASDRIIALDEETIEVLHAHRKSQAAKKLAAGQAWADSGFVFTEELGRPLHPQHDSDPFHLIASRAGLPPVRPHSHPEVALPI
ncbi:hypothetical protein ACQP25_28645 [Microtetraspora malaysiensis]|uniref:hypothetical protein n=1 Tax=Microtetraspora malaysiensis TaxID=161358 RepID=UPI003D90791D